MYWHDLVDDKFVDGITLREIKIPKYPAIRIAYVQKDWVDSFSNNRTTFSFTELATGSSLQNMYGSNPDTGIKRLIMHLDALSKRWFIDQIIKNVGMHGLSPNMTEKQYKLYLRCLDAFWSWDRDKELKINV